MDDRTIRAAYRLRSRLLCGCGRHMWATRRNPEVGGSAALYETCRRCGTERTGRDPASATRAGWFGA